MMVITRYEMYDLDQIVHEIDDDAFINILPTHSVFGRFANENEQNVSNNWRIARNKNRSQKK